MDRSRYRAYQPPTPPARRTRPPRHRAPARPVTPRAPQARRRSPAGAIIIVIVLCLLGGLFLWKPSRAQDTLASVTHKKEEPPAPKLPDAIDTTTIRPTIDATIAQNPSLQIGVAYIDLNRPDAIVTQGVDTPFIAASVGKLLSAITYYHNQEKGQDKAYRDRTEEELRRLIVESDNSVWIPLNDDLGRPAMEAYARSLGMHTYTAAQNTMTARDAALLLKKLYTKELLNEQHTQQLLTYMQQAERNEVFSPTVPAQAKIYHKAGWLDDRLHDVAIIDNGKNPYVVVTFSKSNTKPYNLPKGVAALRGISSALVAGFISSPQYL